MACGILAVDRYESNNELLAPASRTARAVGWRGIAAPSPSTRLLTEHGSPDYPLKVFFVPHRGHELPHPSPLDDPQRDEREDRGA